MHTLFIHTMTLYDSNYDSVDYYLFHYNNITMLLMTINSMYTRGWDQSYNNYMHEKNHSCMHNMHSIGTVDVHSYNGQQKYVYCLCTVPLNSMPNSSDSLNSFKYLDLQIFFGSPRRQQQQQALIHEWWALWFSYQVLFKLCSL